MTTPNAEYEARVTHLSDWGADVDVGLVTAAGFYHLTNVPFTRVTSERYVQGVRWRLEMSDELLRESTPELGMVIGHAITALAFKLTNDGSEGR